ncbi:type I restriction enzyme HsdR N-terminal domain-containing protein [Phormidesmis sp. 146-35]
MQTPEQPLLSEEDVRTRVVAVWLADHGFTAESISVEFSFEIRLGRGILRVGSNEPVRSPVFRPRADVVVRSCDGRNLLVVEVKAPGEPLDESAKEQGISYARLLRVGGIAPFVVLTNGNETRIYDSISGELINDIQVPTSHPYVQNGFRVTTDDIALRSEALETFVSLSPNNLIEFCRRQVDHRMRPLRDDDPYGGKKYIPALYIERNQAKQDFAKRIDREKRRVVVLAGEPQVGKTNFVCHTVEEKLESGIPCLFYPAIGIQQGLLEEIREDFEWIIHDNSAAHQIIHRLTRIIQRVGQRLIIFIDGWNEASQELARAIDKGSERLACDEIQIVISLTNTSANRLLLDDVGNPSYIAEAASIEKSAIPLFEIAPEKLNENFSTVEIQKYSIIEFQRAYEVYARVYNVQVPPTHLKIANPFILRIGMEIFRNKNLPEVIDEPELLEKIIYLKAERVRQMNQDVVVALLISLVREMFAKDAPVSQEKARELWALPATNDVPTGLFEAALLSKVFSARNLSSLDFYYGRERDFLVAYLLRNWTEALLAEPDKICSELSKTTSTGVGLEALRWFLKQPRHFCHLQAVAKLSIQLEPVVRRVISSSVRQNPISFDDANANWLKQTIEQFIADSDIFVKIQAAKLIAEALKDKDKLTSLLFEVEDDKSLEELIAGLLETNEEFSFGRSGAGQVVLETFKIITDSFENYNFELCIDDHGESNISAILMQLMLHQNAAIRQGAAKALGHTAPRTLLSNISTVMEVRTINALDDYIEAIDLATRSLYEIYLGGALGCPGAVQALSDSPIELFKKYVDLHRLCRDIVVSYSGRGCAERLFEFLEIIHEEVEKSRRNAKSNFAQCLELTLPLDCFIPDPEYSLMIDRCYQAIQDIEPDFDN